MRATIKGMKDVIIKQVNGQAIQYTFEPVKYCKQAKVKLFSFTSALSNDGKLSSDEKNNIVIKQQNGYEIVFDRRIKTQDGWVCGVDIFPSKKYSVDHANANVDIAQDGKQTEQHAVNTTHKTLNGKGFSSKMENCKEKKSLNRKGVVVREINAFHKA